MKKEIKGYSFADDRLAFKGSFHYGRSYEDEFRKVTEAKDKLSIRFERSV